MRKLAMLMAGLVLFIGQVLAQNTRTITGKVLDEKGVPVANASITVRGSSIGTVTNEAGNFTINVAEGARVLMISGLDFLSQEISIARTSNVSVTLASANVSLDEVVVVGYGTQRKRDVTSAVATIKGNQVKDIPIQSFDQALSGKAAGVNVTLPNGVLNNPAVIRIRGANSITGSTQPLIVVDGVPTFQGDFSTNLSANNALGTLNPADIEDIQILKDAAATAIYGSRASNGVMLITTKKGKLGKAKVTYDVGAGWTSPFNIFNVMNAEQYIGLKNEALVNLNQANVNSSGQPAGAPLFFPSTINGQAVDTRWSDYIYQTGFQQNHSLSVSGANEATRYYFSTNYNKQEGILQTNTFERKQMRMNVEHRANSFLKLGGNFNYSRGTTFSPSTGSIPGTPFNTAGSARLAFITAPNVSPYAADGRYNIIGIDNAAQRNSFNQIGRNANLTNSGLINPVLVRDLNTISSQIDQITANINAEIKLYKGLYFRSQYGVNYQIAEDKTFYNALHGDGIQTVATTDDGQAFSVIGKYNITNFQNTLNYDFRVAKKHGFNVLLGHEEQSVKSDRWGGSRSGLSDNFFNEFQGNFTINNAPVGNLITENYILSYFGRLNYNFSDKYYVSLNVRRDGYSAFAPGRKYGTFGGASVGYTISEEAFWKSSGLAKVFDNFKLRASYGEVGSVSSVGNFASLSTFGSGQYGLGNPTLFFSQAGNKDLKWETSEKFDVGASFAVWNNRINVELGYYKTNLSDLIIDVPTPPSLGIPGNTIASNAASMYNQGIELGINAALVQNKDFTWNLGFNFTTQKNEVTALAPGVPEIVGTTQLERTNITKVGLQLGSFFLVKSGGVDPATGRRIFVNGAGQKVFFDFSNPVAAQRWRFEDGTVAPPIDLSKDGYVAGSALPKAFGGLNNTFTYKAIDLGIDIYYSFGNSVYFGSRAGLLDQRFWNNTTDVLKRWQKPGDVTEIPKVVFNDNISNGSSFPIDANLYNADFVKFRSISLGFTFPKDIVEKVKLGSARFYVQAFNPFTITNYPGVDPEISVNGASGLTPGVDRNTIGQARTLNVGLNITF